MCFVAKKTISKTNINFLKKLKKNKSLKYENLKVKFSHGSPWKIDQYIYPDTKKKILSKFKKFNNRIFFIGHTCATHQGGSFGLLCGGI